MQRTFMNVAAVAGIGCAVLAATASGAKADDAAPAAPPAWWDTYKVSGAIEAGITGNPDSPRNRINFGHLDTDKANQVVLNQALITFERPFDPKAAAIDFGFKIQGLYGSDGRYDHVVGELDQLTKDRHQLALTEANISAHFPYLTSGGIDARLGQFATLLGQEVLVATGNPLYSHSYIYNFGVPVLHTGLWTTSHVSDMLDIYLGVDTGTNTAIGRGGDNNDALAGLGGFGLNLLDGNLTVLALSHFGPENPRNVPGGNKIFRYYNDILTTLKVNDDLTLALDLNYVRDDIGTGVQAFGAAQYITYALNDTYTLQIRGEVFRDDNGFFVAAFPGNLDFANALAGRPNGSFGVGPNTYGEITVGLNIKPAAGLPHPLDGLLLRPEVRFDDSLSGKKVYDNLTKTRQFTIATDLILPF